MLVKAELNRYNRQMILPELGLKGQEKLKAASILVIGAGGLGCPILQYLAAAGIGTIGIPIRLGAPAEITLLKLCAA